MNNHTQSQYQYDIDFIHRYFALDEYDVIPIMQDAGTRRYYRLNHQKTAMSYIAVVVHIEERSDQQKFCHIAKLLYGAGFHAPQIYHYFENAQLLILEDFGDVTYRKALQHYDMKMLYHEALSLLIRLNRNPKFMVAPLKHYTFDMFINEANLYPLHYLPYKNYIICDDFIEEWQGLWSQIMGSLAPYQANVVLRDMHIDNMFYVPQTYPDNPIGLIDFQDAVLGPPAYDFVSLIEDARMPLATSLQEALLNMVTDQLPYHVKHYDFLHWYHVTGAIRHAKILGIFVRLAQRDHKTHYLQYLPYVEQLFQQKLEHPILFPIKKFLKAYGL